MPSYPPMSPVTSAFYAAWTVLDARDPFTGVTLGELFVRYLQRVSRFDYVQKAMVALNDSCCSFYEVTEVGAHGVTLWDLAGKLELRCWNGSGYSGHKGEIWYVRLLPPFVEGCSLSVTLGSGASRPWKSAFEIGGHVIFGIDRPLRNSELLVSDSSECNICQETSKSPVITAV